MAGPTVASGINRSASANNKEAFAPGAGTDPSGNRPENPGLFPDRHTDRPYRVVRHTECMNDMGRDDKRIALSQSPVFRCRLKPDAAFRHETGRPVTGMRRPGIHSGGLTGKNRLRPRQPRIVINRFGHTEKTPHQHKPDRKRYGTR